MRRVKSKNFFFCAKILLSFFLFFIFWSHGHLNYFLLFISFFLRRSLFHTFFVSIFISIFLSHFCFIVSVFLYSFHIFSFISILLSFFLQLAIWSQDAFETKIKISFFLFSVFFIKKSKELLFRKKFLQFRILRKIFWHINEI